MKVTLHTGEVLFLDGSGDWEYSNGQFELSVEGAALISLNENDIDAINAIQDAGQEEVRAGMIAADNAWERRRFLNETSRELFRDLFARFVDPKSPDASRVLWTAEVAALAAQGAARLLMEVETVAKTLRVGELDVS